MTVTAQRPPTTLEIHHLPSSCVDNICHNDKGTACAGWPTIGIRVRLSVGKTRLITSGMLHKLSDWLKSSFPMIQSINRRTQAAISGGRGGGQWLCWINWIENNIPFERENYFRTVATEAVCAATLVNLISSLHRKLLFATVWLWSGNQARSCKTKRCEIVWRLDEKESVRISKLQ